MTDDFQSSLERGGLSQTARLLIMVISPTAICCLLFMGDWSYGGSSPVAKPVKPATETFTTPGPLNKKFTFPILSGGKAGSSPQVSTARPSPGSSNTEAMPTADPGPMPTKAELAKAGIRIAQAAPRPHVAEVLADAESSRQAAAPPSPESSRRVAATTGTTTPERDTSCPANCCPCMKRQRAGQSGQAAPLARETVVRRDWYPLPEYPGYEGYGYILPDGTLRYTRYRACLEDGPDIYADVAPIVTRSRIQVGTTVRAAAATEETVVLDPLPAAAAPVTRYYSAPLVTAPAIAAPVATAPACTSGYCAAPSSYAAPVSRGFGFGAGFGFRGGSGCASCR